MPRQVMLQVPAWQHIYNNAAGEDWQGRNDFWKFCFRSDARFARAPVPAPVTSTGLAGEVQPTGANSELDKPVKIRHCFTFML